MRNLKRLLSLLLAAASLAALLILPAGAAFTDIRDSSVSEAAEALRVMGVLDGTDEGTFSPNGTLTRAQFAKITVLCMGLADQVAAYETRTIFTDVRDHWAKGYVNLAATQELGENKGRLIGGVGDGTFRPDRPITYGEAVTILLRVLGYSAEADHSWPHGAVSTAASIGLADGLPTIAAGGTITRGQAALLFRNLLLTDVKGGDLYAGKVYKVTEDVILLSADSDGITTTTVDGAPSTLKPARELPSSALVGRMGTLILDSKTGKVLTFLPNKNTRVTGSVSKNATARTVALSDGQSYSVDKDVPVWNGEKQEPYGSAFSAITTGKTVTLYFDEGGSIVYVRLGASGSGSAMVAKNKVSSGTNPFTSLTSGVTNFSIYKNGSPASVDDIRQYDAATYDSLANSLRVSDLRLTGILENAEPNLQTPDTITVMGTKFSVLDCAHQDLTSFKLGDMATLLLTENGEVAGVVGPEVLRGTAVGLFDDGKITLLGSGIVLEPKGFSNGDTKSLAGQLVNVTSYQKDKVSLSRVGGSNAAGSLNVAARTVGPLSLAPGAKIYDRVGDGAMAEIKLEDLVQATVSASRIDFIRRDYAGRIDVLVLKDVTGDSYTYGRLDITGNDDATPQLTVKNAGQGTSISGVNCTFNVRNGAMGGASLRASGAVAAVITLEQIRDVTRNQLDAASMTFTSNTMILPISEEVQCYLKGTDEWKGPDSLSSVLGFSEKFTVYYDRAPEEGGKVRVIVAE